MNTRFQVGIAVVCTMLSGGMVLADGSTGNAEQGESVYRTHCLNCHGAKGRGDGPVADSLTPRPADLTSENVQKKPEKELLTIIRDGAVEYFSYFPFSSAYERQKPSRDNYKGMFKKARPARPQSLGRAERTEEYVSTAKRRERRWRHFSTLPRWKGGNLHAILEGRVIRQAHAGCSGLSTRIGKVILTAEGNSENGPGSG